MGGFRLRTELRLGAAFMLCIAGPTWAQSSGSPQSLPPEAGDAGAARGMSDPRTNDDGIEEIMVTARRIAERVQDVPLSVTAVSAETLRRNSLTSTADLYKIAPSLTINVAANRPATVAVRIRSLAEQSGSLGQDPTVPIYFAEAVINRQTGVSASLFDLSSVQVVKGPQGTLFGRSATGGAVLITPARPTMDGLKGYLLGTLGIYARRELEGAVNLPMGDGLAIRIAGKTTDRRGDIRNQFNGGRLGGGHNDSARASLVWSPSDMFETYFIGDIARLRGAPSPSYAVGYRPGSPAATIFPGLPAYIDGRRGADIKNNSLNAPHDFSVINRGITNISELTLGSVTIKNIIGLRRILAREQVDADGTPFPVLAVADQFRTRQFTEELQLQGKAFGERLSYVVGGNYFKERNLQINFTSLFGGPQARAFVQPRTLSKALFAQGTFEVMPDLRLTAGARYTWDTRYLTSTQRNPAGVCALFDATNTPLPEPCVKDVRTSFRKPSYTLGIDYKPSEEVLLYLARRQGYRSGGFTASASRPDEFTPFKPEIVKDVEGGAKVDWRIGGMPVRTNLAIFYAKYTNIQRTLGNLSPGGVLTQQIFNAAAATIKGGEFEFSMKPASVLEISGYLAMSKARYDRFVNPGSGADLSSNRFAAAPDYMGRISVDYTLPFSSDTAGEFHLIGAYRRQSKIKIGDINEIGVGQAAYGVADFRLDWDRVSGRPITLSAFVTNAFDKNYIANGAPLRSAIGVSPVVYGERRMVGISARYAFGNE